MMPPTVPGTASISNETPHDLTCLHDKLYHALGVMGHLILYYH